MAKEIRPVDYHSMMVFGGAAEAAGILGDLTESGVGLLAFSVLTHNDRVSQLDLIPDDIDSLEKAVARLGLHPGERKTGFLIRGLDRPLAMAQVLRRLDEAHIAVTAVQAVSAGAGRFGALVRVKPDNFDEAATVLGADEFDRRVLYSIVGEIPGPQMRSAA